MILSVFGKCRDMFAAICEGMEYDGYVPEFLGGGDMVALQIDVETGKILNWDSKAAKTWMRENLKDAI